MTVKQKFREALIVAAALCSLFGVCLAYGVPAVAAPVADVKLNGSDGPITLTQADTLTVSIAVDGGGVTASGDYWLVLGSPFGFFFAGPDSWSQAVLPFEQGPISSFGPLDILSIPLAGVPTGTYTFYFGLDMAMDGALNIESLSYDYATVHIVAPGGPGSGGNTPYAVDYNDGKGNHIFGTICNGLSNPFTLSFDSGGYITGTLAFTPSGGSGGTVHLSGSFAAGATTYTGDGTYTIGGGPSIVINIPYQIATYPTGSVQTPGISDTYPLIQATTCP